MHSVRGRNEGFPVPVQTRRITLTDGTTGTAHGFDLSDAEVPDRHYHARVCSIDFAHGTVELLFAQPRRDHPDQLRTLLVVSMSMMSTLPFIESIDRLQSPSLDEIAAKHDIAAEPLISFTSEAEQTVEVDANIVAAAFSGPESCLDFYHASAFSIAALASTNRLNMIPVVRVNTRTSLVLGLISRIRELQRQFPPNVQLVGAST